MKFTLDTTLPETLDGTNQDAAVGVPFAEAVFAAGGVAAIFGVNDFITVRRQPGFEWDPIVAVVVAAAAAHLYRGCVDERQQPESIDVSKDAAVTVTYLDGYVAQFDLVSLRQGCPCATCRDLREREKTAGPDRIARYRFASSRPTYTVPGGSTSPGTMVTPLASTPSRCCDGGMRAGGDPGGTECPHRTTATGVSAARQIGIYTTGGVTMPSRRSGRNPVNADQRRCPARSPRRRSQHVLRPIGHDQGAAGYGERE